MNSDAAPAAHVPPMRCRRCFYILNNLTVDRCPECGTTFDPADPTTFTRRVPFVFWTYWLPAVLLVGVGGGIVWSLLVLAVGFGAATTIVVPVSIGGVIGYGSNARGWSYILRSLLGLFAIAWGASILSLAVVGFNGLLGGLCFSVMAVIALVPVAVGVLLGILLRMRMRRSSFSQRDYLVRKWTPYLLLILPGVGAAFVEGRHDRMPIVSVSTVTVIDAPPEAAWKGIQFYEDVRRPTPWLLRVSPSLRPVKSMGRAERIGDLKTCVYERGHLTKQITGIDKNHRLVFKVVDQTDIENAGVTLIGGSFELEPIDGGRQTRVTLTTTYAAKLQPRFAYAWAEAWTVHTLHEHVLAGMRDTAKMMQ